MKCPLYKEAVDAQLWQSARSPHFGLLFDKFADAWQTTEGRWEFDKGNDPGAWTRQFSGRLCGHPGALEEVCHRQAELVHAFDGRILCFINVSRFVIGMGREHPMENGFTLHHTLGVPYLPASGLKGVLAAWLREVRPGDWDWKKSRWKKDTDGACWFGTQDSAGRLALLDMVPAKQPKLVVDIMTPHYGPYYQDGEVPGDWHSPTPIPFLAVEKGQIWQVAIIPGPVSVGASNKHRALEKSEMAELADRLVEALDWLGAGAKTAVGYGRFERDSATEEQIRKEVENRRAEEKEAREHERELASLPPELADLHRRANAENWSRDKSAFLNGVERYLAEKPNPSGACVDWLKELIEQWDPGIWQDPDKTKGKKRKPAYKERSRQLVHKLKSALGENDG